MKPVGPVQTLGSPGHPLARRRAAIPPRPAAAMTSSFVDTDATALAKSAQKKPRLSAKQKMRRCTEQLSGEFPTLGEEIVGKIVTHAFAIMHQDEAQVRARVRWICKLFLIYSEILQARLRTIFPRLAEADRAMIHRAVLQRRAVRGAALHAHSERRGFLTFGFHAMVVEALCDVRAVQSIMSNGVRWPSHATTLRAVARVMVHEELRAAESVVDPVFLSRALSEAVARDDTTMTLATCVMAVRARWKHHTRTVDALPMARISAVIASVLPAQPSLWPVVQGRVVALLQTPPTNWWRVMRPMERVLRVLVRCCAAGADCVVPLALPDLVRLVMHDEFPHIDATTIFDTIVLVESFPVVQRRPNLLLGLVRGRLKEWCA